MVERLELLPSIVSKTVVVGGGKPRVRSEMSGSEEKPDDFDYHVRERCVTEN
jgi:hypothetical protein